MTIERFTREEFEEVLDEIFGRNWQLDLGGWGELSYAGVIGNGKFIRIMSSINSKRNVADSTGKNSIRVWLTDEHNKPLMPKINHWTTRLPGWQERLKSQVQLLTNMAKSLKWCDECYSFETVWKVKKNNKNKGKLFARCQCENSFRWFD